MKFNKMCFSFFINQTKCVHTKPFHHSIAAGDCTVGHMPHDHMCRFLVIGHKIPKCIMCRRCLWHFVMWLGFYGMYKIRELDGILNMEYRHVVPDKIIISFFRIKLHRKSTYVSYSVCGSTASCNCRKSSKYRNFRSWFLKKFCFRIVFHRFIQFELSMGCVPSGMNNSFRNSFMIKMGDFFT